MTLPWMRFTARRRMVAVAVVALMLIPVIWIILIRVDQALEDFYGPGGRLETTNHGKPDPGPRRSVCILSVMNGTDNRPGIRAASEHSRRIVVCWKKQWVHDPRPITHRSALRGR